MSLPELFVPDRPNLRILDTTTSTNDHARTWARTGAPDGATVVADRQTSGRGRSGRSWDSPPGVNLYISQVVRAPLESLRLASILGAVAAQEALEAKLPDSSQPVIKWPNDLLVHGSKLAGILAELENLPQPTCILGLGINVNLDESNLPVNTRIPATSMRLVTGKILDRRRLLIAVLDALNRWRAALDHNQQELLEAFNSHCITLGKRVRVTIPGRSPFLATAHSVDREGHLLVQDHQGRSIPLLAGDVDLLS